MPGSDTHQLFQRALVRLAGPASLSADCVVIGSGAGGALAASFLAEKGRDVLLIEEGPLEFSGANCGISETFPALWREGGAIPILGNVSLVFGEGRCFGGSTMINAGLINRAPAEVLWRWKEEYAIQDLDEHSFERYEKRVENELRAEPYDDSENPVSRILRTGSGKKGFAGAQVPVARFKTESGYKKSTMRETYLKRAAVSGMRVLADCRVGKIEIAAGQAVSLKAVWDTPAGKKHIRVSFKTIFICAGTLQSALLLRRSGVKKNVGDTVQFHPTLRVIARFNAPLNASLHEMPSFQIKEFTPSLTMGASITNAAFMASGLSLHWNANRSLMRDAERMAIFYVGVKSASLGKARNIPFLGRSYLVKYDLLEEDMRALAFGYAQLSSLLFAAGAERLYPALNSASEARSEAETEKYLQTPLSFGDVNLVSIHSYGSCPMGENRKTAALDSYGKLHGFQNIFVHDGSMLPSSPGVNPQGPIMAMVLRCLEKNFE